MTAVPPTDHNAQPWRRSARFMAGAFLISSGAVILAAVCFYYGLRMYHASQLDEMAVEIAAPAALPPTPKGQTEIHGALMPDGSFKPITTVVKSAKPSAVDRPPTEPSAPPRGALSPSPLPAEPSLSVAVFESPIPAPIDQPVAEAVSADAPLDGGALVGAYNSIYPALAMHPKYWERPTLAGADPYTYGVVKRPDGFMSISASEGLPRGMSSDAARIRIPSIDVDSEVANLAILDIGDSRQYETPAHVVGRIPQTSNPGEMGNTWLFGHLESLIRGEGNVFHRLPEIPNLLNSGDPVYVSLENQDGDEFLYQITATRVVRQEDLALYDTDDSTITLVACVPRLIYDHRIVVTGKLVGVKRAA